MNVYKLIIEYTLVSHYDFSRPLWFRFRYDSNKNILQNK